MKTAYNIFSNYNTELKRQQMVVSAFWLWSWWTAALCCCPVTSLWFSDLWVVEAAVALIACLLSLLQRNRQLHRKGAKAR